MLTERHKTRTQEMLEEVWHQRNTDALDTYLTPDFIAHDVPGHVEPNREGVKQWVQHLLSAFPDYHITIEDQIIADDKIVTRWTATATHKGTLMGIPPTDRAIMLKGINIYRTEGGRIAEEWQRVDEMVLMEQLGVVSKPE